MTAARVGSVAWVAIYVGMALVALGIALQRSDAALGWSIAVVGGLGVAVGIVLIWLRSRMDPGT